MAMTKEEQREFGRKAAANWIAQRRADPEKMKKWQRAMRLGRLRAARERKLAGSTKKETTVAKGKGKHWASNPKLARAAALKGARTKKRNRLERERELAARATQRRVVDHHSPDDLVHLEFPVVAGARPVRSTNGGYEGGDLTQLTPIARKQLALEGLRFVRILLE